MRLALVLLGLVSVAVMVAAREPQRPNVTGVAHIALFVHDMDKARAYYKDFLGYGEPFDLKNADGSLAMTFIKINDRQYLELSPEREAGADRLNHIGVETNDVEAMRTYLKARGIAVPDKVTRSRVGNLSVTVKDPDGHGVEFVQYMPDGWMVRDTGKFLPAEAISTDMRHVGILVGSLDASLAFYRDVLGFREIWRGSRDEKELSWVNLQVPDGRDYIEFMLYGELPAPAKRGSQHHLCLFVPDIAKALAQLQPRATRVGYAAAMEPRTGINRRRQLNLFDPDGTRTELMEPTTVDGAPAPPSPAPPPRR
jgi:catechol 2,3-dioxygenase-like lactoylglutathione lyase family enzyme